MSVALLVFFLLLSAALVAGGLYLFVSGLTARANACRPPLGLRLPGVKHGSREWERAHRCSWPTLFGGGVLGTAHAIALAATLTMDAHASVRAVFAVSGVIIEVSLWMVARAAGKATLRSRHTSR